MVAASGPAPLPPSKQPAQWSGRLTPEQPRRISWNDNRVAREQFDVLLDVLALGHVLVIETVRARAPLVLTQIEIDSALANSLRPPASEISCITVLGPVRGYAPGAPISPVMNTFRLLICLTTTVTFGSVRNLVAAD